MDLLADVHVKDAYITALRADGHDVTRVVDVETLGGHATDADIVEYARTIDAVILTNDAKDFAGIHAHPGVIIVPQVGTTAGAIASAISRIDGSIPDTTGLTLYVTEWE